MSFRRVPRAIPSGASRARAEAYAGLLLLVLGLTVFVFGHCTRSPFVTRSRPVDFAGRVSREPVPNSVQYGNALQDGGSSQGWWVGHFMPKESPRYSSQVETKWAIHRRGTKHNGFSANKVATSMAILISGRHRLEFDNASVLLERPGDYVIWNPGVAHSWSAIDDSTMLCIRWPSISDDQVHSFSNASAPLAVRVAMQHASEEGAPKTKT